MQLIQQWTETSAFFIWLRESPSIWAYPTVFFLHTLGVVFTAGASLVVSARVLGAASALPLAPFARFYRFIWIGFWLTVASGVVMLLSDFEARLTNRLFPIKMLLVAGAVAALVLLRRRVLARAAPGETAAPPSGRALAAVSLLCWLGAVAAGRFMAFFQ